jgi:RNA polymerase sigma-70 factor, ECF subfamily
VNEDSQLIDLALAGDRAAFGQLVSKYQDRLYNTLVHVVGCTEEARDVCQDAFVQAMLKLASFHRRSAFYTWLYRIAFNLAASRRRRQKPTMSVESNREATGDEPTSHDDGPSQRLERQERAKQVRHALNALSDDFRAVLVLREMDGYDYETISDMLDLPLGTVRSRLHRARSELREHLKGVLVEESK